MQHNNQTDQTLAPLPLKSRGQDKLSIVQWIVQETGYLLLCDSKIFISKFSEVFLCRYERAGKHISSSPKQNCVFDFFKINHALIF